MISSQFVFVGLLVLGITGSALSKPYLEKDFFWYPTDKGTIVPAFLRGQPETSKIRAIEDDVIFWHYLPGESEGRKVTINCNDGCTDHFIRDAPLILFAHGFGSSHTGGYGTSQRAGFGNRSEPVNLIFINWSKLSGAPWYESAANNVKPVGEYVAQLVNFLFERGLATREKTIFQGHSLGAHISNYVSANLNGGKLERIIATDPALPLFGVKDDSERIDPTDANFVNVIHTSMGTLMDGGLAFEEPRGHVDFYPNSGKDQPGCGCCDFGACSHSRSYYYLSESISNPTAFPACKCTDWEEFDSGRCDCQDREFMAWDTPTTARGVYYLRTNSQPPYGQPL